MAAALRLNDLLSLDRNHDLDPARRIPDGRLVPLEECRRLCPGFPTTGVSGGALWHDARLTHPERLALAFLRAAAEQGALVANHCAVDQMLAAGGAVAGVAVRDRLSGQNLEIRGRTVVLAAGPWTPGLGGGDPARFPCAFALNLELGGRLAETAVGLRALSGPAEDPVIGGGRYLFLNPLAHTTLLGTWYALAEGRSESGLVAEGAAALLGELRDACPTLGLDAANVVGYQSGWLPLKAGREPGRPTALADRPRVIDHGAAGGLRDMFSVEGVKFTTARRVAERVTDRLLAALGHPARPCRTADTPLVEGDEPESSLEARVRRAVRTEMAERLGDIFRRLAPGGRPGAGADLDVVARLAALELGWTEQRKDAEIEAVKRSISQPGSPPERVA
jgi:glycerol-3-phosphate dehydrogenase